MPTLGLKSKYRHGIVGHVGQNNTGDAAAPLTVHRQNFERKNVLLVRG